MRVFLCEKPSQARDIAAVLGASQKGDGCLLGQQVAVTWCYGHLLEMAPPEAYDPAYKRWNMDTLPILPGEWKTEVKKDGAKQFRAIRTLLKQASEVVVATDADREGETIGREVLEALNWRGRVLRLWLSALDPASIRKALGQLLPGEKTAPLYLAGLGRARADWLVGMNLTRAFTLLGAEGSGEGVRSVGRVQTPTLRLVVERDQPRYGGQPLREIDAERVGVEWGARYDADGHRQVEAGFSGARGRHRNRVEFSLCACDGADQQGDQAGAVASQLLKA